MPAAQAPRGAASARSAPARRAPPLRGRTRTTPDGRGARRSKISIYRSDVTLPEEAAQLQAMLTQLKPSVAVKDTGETKQIGAWKTRKYVLTLSSAMVTTEQEIWTTSDVRPDTAGAYRDMLAGMQDALPTMAELAKATRALEGMPILTISKASVAGQTVTTSQEIVSIDEAAAPSGAYAIPAGYAVAKFNPLG